MGEAKNRGTQLELAKQAWEIQFVAHINDPSVKGLVERKAAQLVETQARTGTPWPPLDDLKVSVQLCKAAGWTDPMILALALMTDPVYYVKGL